MITTRAREREGERERVGRREGWEKREKEGGNTRRDERDWGRGVEERAKIEGGFCVSMKQAELIKVFHETFKRIMFVHEAG